MITNDPAPGEPAPRASAPASATATGLALPDNWSWPYRPDTPWPPIAALLAAGIAIVAVRIFVSLLALGAMEIGAEFHLALMTATLLQQVLLVGAVLMLARTRGGQPLAILPMAPPVGGRWAYVRSGAVLVVVAGSMSAILHAIDPNLIKQDLRPFVEMLRSPHGWLLFPIVTIGAPLSEELLFRGFLFAALCRSPAGPIGAAVLTSAAWASVHAYSIAGVVQVFVIGLVFAWMVLRTGSLRVPIVLHAVYNLVLAIVLASGAGSGVMTP